MMPLHRRQVTNIQEQTDDPTHRSTVDASGSLRLKSLQLAAKRPWLPIRARYKIILIGSIQIMLMRSSLQSTLYQRNLESLLASLASFFGTLPFSLALAVGLGAVGGGSPLLPHQQYIPLAFLASIASNHIPQMITSAFVSCGLVLFGLASRPIHEGGNRSSSETVKMKQSTTSGTRAKNGDIVISEPIKVLLAVLMMITVLLTENFLIWVVSATYHRSQDRSNLPEPLQDNGQIILRYLFGTVLGLSKRTVVTIRNAVNVQWALVAGLGLSFVTLELQGTDIGRHMWPMARRSLFTLTISRAIRTISFLITVLPSQNTQCYFQHFPAPPNDWPSWLMIGFTPQAHGGCNDLIISGHATVTATVASIVVSVVDNKIFSAAVWMLLAMDYMVEIYEGFHYSVDMFLGAVLVSLVWTALAPIEKNVSSLQSPEMRFKPLGTVSLRDLIEFSIPAFGAFLQVSGIIPRAVANYTILSYVLVAMILTGKYGFKQYTQHTMFCLLYIALGTYL